MNASPFARAAMARRTTASIFAISMLLVIFATPAAAQAPRRLTVGVAGTGTVAVPNAGTCASSCDSTSPDGSIVTLTATPTPGWVFERWTGDCVTSSPVCTVRMDADRRTIARFLRSGSRRVAARTDFDGDRRSDLTVWRRSTGAWWTLFSSTGRYSEIEWGV